MLNCNIISEFEDLLMNNVILNSPDFPNLEISTDGLDYVIGVTSSQ